MKEKEILVVTVEIRVKKVFASNVKDAINIPVKEHKITDVITTNASVNSSVISRITGIDSRTIMAYLKGQEISKSKKSRIERIINLINKTK